MTLCTADFSIKKKRFRFFPQAMDWLEPGTSVLRWCWPWCLAWI